jgi:hypothetical protein
MTVAAVFSKVSMMLAQTKVKDELSAFVREDRYGELTDKEYSRRGKHGGVVHLLENRIQRFFKSEDEMSSIIRAFLPYVALDACKSNKLMVLEELFCYDEDLLLSHNYESYNLMHAQVLNYNRRILEFVTSKYSHEELKQAINHKTVYGMSPLDYCIKLKQLKAMEDLRVLGAVYDTKHVGRLTVADFLE